MIDLKNVLPEDAVFNTLVDMRKDIKQLLKEVPAVATSRDILEIYHNNMTVYKVLEILDKYQMEVI